MHCDSNYSAHLCLKLGVTQDMTSTRPQYKEEDEAAREERINAYIELLTREVFRKKNGGWLGGFWNEGKWNPLLAPSCALLDVAHSRADLTATHLPHTRRGPCAVE